MTRRWRLFPKYALLIITLVGSMLVASGAIGLYFSWRETEAHLVALQIEKAQNAATRIEQYILDIEHQISWTALPRADADGDALEQRRIEYLKLQRQAPAITEVVWIDPAGREQLRISRLAMDAVGGGTDLSQEEKFRVASKGAVYYGPVYFRKGTEPYMTIARPAGSGGGVTAAEVNLKFVWDVVSRIKIGSAGLAYVVDADGVLIAHPDISLVLKKSDLKALPQVTARDAAAPSPLGRDLQGNEVFAAHAPIPTLRWTVFVESPRNEAFAPLYATLQRTSFLLVVALLISIAASFFLARALVRPLRALQEGAAQIGAGDLERHIEVRTGDELEGLAEQFNRMSAQLRESYAGLERKVEQRTAELTETLEQQTVTAEVLRVISSSVADAQPVFDKIVQSCERLFAGTRVAINLVHGNGTIYLGAYGGPGREEFAAIFPLPLSGESGTGSAILQRKVMHYPDVETGPDVPKLVRRASEATGTKSLIIAPMILEDRGIGSILVARDVFRAFSANEIALLKTFADQAVIAIENARLFNETQEALEQQTATAEVLSVISGSIADSVPVFEKILERCAHLFSSSEQGVLLLGEDQTVHLAAHRGSARDRLAPLFPSTQPPDLATSIFSGRVLHYKDVLADADVPTGIRNIALRIDIGTYSQMFAPMVWEGRAIGTLYVTRQPPTGFTDKEIGLLRTFADQAVIAIQNARLFNETREALHKVEQRTAEVTEALDYQTAISDVLRVISQSPTDVSPVFEAILASASRLFGSPLSAVFRYDGRLVHIAATRNWPEAAIADASRFYPAPPNPKMLSGRVILSGSVQSEEDALTDPQYDRQAAGLGHWRRMIGAPLLRDGQPIGAIIVAWQDPGKTPTRQADLLKTFADQAVIAIENVRLLSETTEALEQQTATAEVLQVISSSVADTQPVFDKILDSCERLFNSTGLGIYGMTDDGTLRIAASRTKTAKSAEILKVAAEQPAQLGTRSPGGTQRHLLLRAIRECRMLHYDNVLGAAESFDNAPSSRDPWIDGSPVVLRHAVDGIADYSIVIAPMLRAGHTQGRGALLVCRDPAQSFTARELELIGTFADQAAIAIQNARLFNETKEALEQQTATAEVLQVISSSVADTAPVFDKILDSCERLFAASGLGIYLIDASGMLQMGGFRGKTLGLSESAHAAAAASFPRPLADTATELAIRERRVVHYPDVLADPDVPLSLRRIATATHNFSIAFAPMLWEGRGVGAIQVSRDPPAPFSDKELTLLKTFADQAVIAIQNSRLFNEIQAKSRELEMANKHKSEFLANMSHELRTPLNAIIGFSEVLSEKMFGEVNDKQLEYLLDIHTSGHHLLSLINDILDLSKIEAGRMELDLATTSLPMLLDNCTTLVRERANRQGLVLALEVEDGLGDWVADIRKLKQVVINLLSNAVKFTPAGGRVTLRARRLEHAVEIAVVDTGVGIAVDQQALVFEEFRQAGGDYLRKSEGTGLGLSLAKRFVELHGGSMRVESAPGHGSTFAFVLPERVLEAV
ncbi:MAG: GAF domain-containing protein [Caldimonas sp.]